MRLLEGLHQAAENQVIDALASAEVATSESAMGECATACGTLVGVLDGTNWEIFEAISGLADERAKAADLIRVSVREALMCDEHVRPLGASLKEAQSKAVRLLTTVKSPPAAPATPKRPSEELPPSPSGPRVVDQGTDSFEEVASAQAKLDGLARRLAGGQTLRVMISWRIEEESTKP
jgi:hypothetical protein